MTKISKGQSIYTSAQNDPVFVVSDQLQTLIKNPPSDWEDPKIKVIHTALNQPGILPSILKRNPELINRLTDFFLGKKPILLIGGESGMGKSLLATDLRIIYKDLMAILPEPLKFNLVVISWDRTHQAFFEQASTELGSTIPLPKGETKEEARKIVSAVMIDAVKHAYKYLGTNTKIIMESPLYDSRGEEILEEMQYMKHKLQTLIMHSPKTRYETFNEGRIMSTSGQPEFMQFSRQKLLRKIMGDNFTKLSQDAHDVAVKSWWENKVSKVGAVVEWDPDDDRAGYKYTIEEFRKQKMGPDILYPRAISKYVRRHYESVFETIPNLDNFLDRLLH